MGLMYRVSVGGPDTKPDEKPADQVWRGFVTTQIAPHFVRANDDMPELGDEKSVLKLFSQIRGHRVFGVFAGIGNEGVDLPLYHGLDWMRVNRKKFPVKIELVADNSDKKFYGFTVWDVVIRNMLNINEGYVLNFDVKGHLLEQETY